MALMLGLTQRLHRLHSPSDGPSPCHFHRRFLRISTNLAASGSRHQPEPSPRSQPQDSPSLLSEPGLGAEPGEGGHAFEDAPAIGETPCRLKPRDDGTRAPGGRWVCGGFLRLAVCYRSGFALALDCRRSSGRCGSAALAWLGSATAGHSGKPHAPLFRGNCAGGPSERVGQQLQPNQLISRRFEARQTWFG